MTAVDIRIILRKKGLTEEQILSIIVNVLEHIAQERDFWEENGVIDSFEQVEPIVLSTLDNKKLADKANTEIRKGYYFGEEQYNVNNND